MVIRTFEDATNYVYTKRSGTIDELRKNVGTRYLRALELTGIIHRGQSKKINTWVNTKSSRESMEVDQNKNATFTFNTIMNYCSHFLKNKTLPV